MDCFWDGKKPAKDPFAPFEAIQPINPPSGIEDEVIKMTSKELHANAHRPFYLTPTTYNKDGAPVLTVLERMSGIGEIDSQCVIHGHWT